MAVVAAVVLVVAIVVVTRRSDHPASVAADPTSTVPVRSAPTAPTTTTTSPGSTLSTVAAASSTTAQPSCAPVEAVHRWPIRRRLGQLLMVGIAPSSTRAAADAAAAGLGGVFIRHDDKSTAVYTSGRLRDLATPEGVPLAVAVDDEGGRVQSISALAGPMPSARVMAQTMSPIQVRSRAKARAEKLRSYGVTVDFAPDADVSAQPDRNVIGDRSFSNDPARVVVYAQAFSEGLADGGITPVFKHFPGHGHAVGDSHTGASRTPPLNELESSDLVPFRGLAGTAGSWVMVGHLQVPGLTDGLPASLSPAAIGGLLRTDLGYQGVVVSDELGGMAAVADRYTLPDAVRRFLDAGGDIALWQGESTPNAVLDALEAAVRNGSLAESKVDASVVRILAAKHHDPCATP